MAKLPSNIVTFAQGNADVIKIYEQAKDYYCHYMFAETGKRIGDFDASVSLADKDAKVHKALLSEIKRLSGVSFEGLSMEAWSTNPTVKWATFATVGMMIDAIIPDTIIKSTGIYCEMDTVGFGETLTYDIEPNSLFTVSESANAQRTGFNKKQFNTSVTLQAVNHQITVEVALYKVLSGKESLGKFMRKAVMSVERQMTVDAYNAFRGLIANASVPSALKATGYTMDSLLTICQTVEAYNNGSKPTIIGTTKALSKVIPNGTNYRINTDSDNMSINLIKGFFKYDILELPQVATGVLTGANAYGLALKDDELYILSTGADKLVKGVIEGTTLSNVDQPYDNADLTQHATMNKRWGFLAVSNAIGGYMKLQ